MSDRLSQWMRMQEVDHILIHSLSVKKTRTLVVNCAAGNLLCFECNMYFSPLENSLPLNTQFLSQQLSVPTHTWQVHNSSRQVVEGHLRETGNHWQNSRQQTE